MIEAAAILTWRKDIVRFCREVLQAEPDAWQLDVLLAFQNPATRRLAMKACKNPGKTAVLSWCAWWFLVVYPEPNVICTSVTGDNLSDGLWKEMAKWQGKSPLLMSTFTWTATKIFNNDYPATWFAAARNWPRSADSTLQASTLAGKHMDYMLFILDEAGTIPRAVMAAADAALGSGIITKILIAGNPEALEGALYDACVTDRSLWTIFEITGDPNNPKRAPRVSLQWATELITKYGMDDPFVMVNVLGKFPPASFNALLGPDQVTESQNRHLVPDQFSFAQKRLGIDVARELGGDRSVIIGRQGLLGVPPVILRGAEGTDLAARIALAKSRWNSEVEFIDDTGGWAGAARLAYKMGGHNAIPINFSGKANDPRYYNKRSEMWFEMAQWVKKGGVLPRHPDLHRELCSTRYTFKSGRMIMEEKEQVKARLGFSPDVADAFCLTFAWPDMPAKGMVIGTQQHQRGVLPHEWDPFKQDSP